MAAKTKGIFVFFVPLVAMYLQASSAAVATKTNCIADFIRQLQTFNQFST